MGYPDTYFLLAGRSSEPNDVLRAVGVDDETD